MSSIKMYLIASSGWLESIKLDLGVIQRKDVFTTIAKHLKDELNLDTSNYRINEKNLEVYYDYIDFDGETETDVVYLHEVYVHLNEPRTIIEQLESYSWKKNNYGGRL